MSLKPENTPRIQVTWPQLEQRSLWSIRVESNPGSIPPEGDTAKPFERTQSGRQSEFVAAVDVPDTQPGGCEYLDHTADVQLHAWGSSDVDAYAAAVVGLHAYMVDAPGVEATHSTTLEARAHDECSMIYAILDEALFLFASEGFVITRARVSQIDKAEAFDCGVIKVWGYYFQHGVHPQGTEVKAITYSNMHVVRKDDKSVHLYVIVDI